MLTNLIKLAHGSDVTIKSVKIRLGDGFRASLEITYTEDGIERTARFTYPHYYAAERAWLRFAEA